MTILWKVLPNVQAKFAAYFRPAFNWYRDHDDDDRGRSHDDRRQCSPVRNYAPEITSPACFTVLENTTAVGTVRATDKNGDALRYAISGIDAALFQIDAATGRLSFRAAPDFEAPADRGANNVYDIVVTASDGKATDSQCVRIAVKDVAENRAPVFTGPATFSIAENATAAGTVTASDPDGQTLTFSLAGGADAALFRIDPTSGAISFIDSPDFELPRDAGADNVYDLIVSASDGTDAATQAVSVAVTDVVEGRNAAPVFSGPVNFAIDENTSLVTAVVASDADNDAVTYLIIGGDDAGLFQIDPGLGILSFVNAPDFEIPLDAGADNVYNLTIAVTDGKATTAEDISVQVLNVNERVNIAPTIVGFLDFSITTKIKAISIATEPARAPVNPFETGVIGQVLASDANSDTLVFSVSGEDAGRFTIDGLGQLSVDAPLLPFGSIDGDNNFEFTITAADPDGALDDLSMHYFVVSVA